MADFMSAQAMATPSPRKMVENPLITFVLLGDVNSHGIYGRLTPPSSLQI